MNNNFPETNRLYYQDSHLLKFSANVLDCQPYKEYWAVRLDQTAFYPTGGGQPNDIGYLRNDGITSQLIDCIDNEKDVIHIVDKAINGQVNGEINVERRRDHLQQHTGQHILSQAFIQIANAETRGFHLGTESATIDLAIDQLNTETLYKVEDLANKIIFENRQINVHLTDEKDKFALRKDTERSGCIRIIEITDFDHSPCGGTHAKNTGEVGLIVIRSVERVKKMCRIEFLCGRRALLDYRAAHSSALAVANLFSAGRDNTTSLVVKLQQDYKDLQKRSRELLELALSSEAANIYQNTVANSNGIKAINLNLKRDLDELKTLVQLLVAYNSVIVLALTTLDSPKLIFARSKDLTSVDSGKLLGKVCQEFGGRGGGRAEMAQGGLPATIEIEKLLANLADLANSF